MTKPSKLLRLASETLRVLSADQLRTLAPDQLQRVAGGNASGGPQTYTYSCVLK